MDAHWESVASLLHFDGTDEDTSTTDEIGSVTWTLSGGASLQSEYKKFGATSLLCATGDRCTSTNLPDIGTGDFCIEGWVDGVVLAANRYLFDFRDTGGSATAGGLYYDGSKLVWYASGGYRITGSTNLMDGTWHHFALARVSGVTRLFLDGAQEGSDYSDSTNYQIGSNGFVWGNYSVSAVDVALRGYLDDCRITIGAGRYAATFTPPTEAFDLGPYGPTIDTQPSADSVVEGETASFSVTASGTGTLSYQWYETTAGAISGATSSTYAFTASLADDGNGYYCAVTDDNGTTNTDTAALEVTEAPSDLAITNPSAQEVEAGEVATFSVEASLGAGGYTYQWYESTAGALGGETDSTLSITTTVDDDGNSYYCIVTDAELDTKQSAAASLTVNQYLNITSEPAPVAVLVGDTAEFTVTVGDSNQGTVTYQWSDSVNGELSGETSATLSFTASKSQDGRLYTCVVADDVDSIIVGARLTVSRVLAIAAHPSAVAADAGDVAIFTVAATGDAPISYQWYGPGGLLPGEVAPTLAIEARPAGEGNYYCAVAAGSQSVNSNTAALTVTVQAPTISSGASDVSVPVGGIASFAVSASGYGGLAYQWYRDGVAIGGATRDNYSTQVDLEDTGAEFYCVVSDAHGSSEQSSTGTLTVLTVSVDDQTEQVVQEGIGPTAAPTWRSSDWAAMVRAQEAGKPFYVDDYRFSGRTFRHRDQLENPREE